MKALFLDRDGVINHDVGYACTPERITFREGIFPLCRRFHNQGYLLIVVTNQSGIARGKFSEAQFLSLMNWMGERFIEERCPWTAFYYCPHSPASDCKCRKPRPGMFRQAALEHDIELGRSVMIGDTESDMMASSAAGVGKYIDASQNGPIKHLLDIRI